MNSYLVQKLKEGRLAKNLKQSDVAHLINVKGNTLSNYENGVSEPDIDTFCALCDIYGLDPAEILGEAYGLNVQGSDFDIKPSEIDKIKKYRSLDSYGKDMVDTVLDKEYARSSEQTAAGCGLCETPAVYHLPYYHSLASAGSGEYIFDDIPADIITVPDTPVARSADFIIGVNGHSMEPHYMDGDKVYVRKTSEISAGRIGIFVQGNNCYIKEYASDRLISLNHEYPDIPASDDISLVGEVIGKVNN